jgi:hypothetical protein
MSDDPVALLEHLLAQEPSSQNVHFLKGSRDFFEPDWTYEEMGAIEAEFARDLRAVAARVAAVWGAPDFIGHRSESEFPTFYTAEEMCYWRRGSVLAMIWWEHQDKEVPVLLALAVLPLDYVTG